MASTAARLKKAGRPKISPVDVGGEQFHVRGLSGAERVHLFKLQDEYKERDDSFGMTGVAALGLCEDDGTRVFGSEHVVGDEKWKDAIAKGRHELLELDPDVAVDIATKVMQLSGLMTTSVEDAAKNLTASPSSSSGTGSPSTSEVAQ